MQIENRKGPGSTFLALLVIGGLIAYGVWIVSLDIPAWVEAHKAFYGQIAFWMLVILAGMYFLGIQENYNDMVWMTLVFLLILGGLAFGPLIWLLTSHMLPRLLSLFLA